MTWLAAAGPVVIALLIGVALAVASSSGSLAGRHGYVATASAQPTPTAADASPTPSVASAGLLGDGARLDVIGSTSSLAMESATGGTAWTALRPPLGGSGIAIDEANVRHAITGGSNIRVSRCPGGSRVVAEGDGSWRIERAPAIPHRENPVRCESNRAVQSSSCNRPSLALQEIDPVGASSSQQADRVDADNRDITHVCTRSEGRQLQDLLTIVKQLKDPVPIGQKELAG